MAHIHSIKGCVMGRFVSHILSLGNGAFLFKVAAPRAHVPSKDVSRVSGLVWGSPAPSCPAAVTGGPRSGPPITV
jgi:hypothetical protein